MIKEYHKWRDRRHASGTKPIVFLLLELILLCLISWFVFIVAPLWIAIIVVVSLLYFFMTNCLRRYHNIKNRQQFYESEE